MTEIKRMVHGLQTRENSVAQAERTLAAFVVQSRQPAIASNPKRLDRIKQLIEVGRARVDNAKSWRDFTVARLRKYIDYALSKTPYAETRCPTCRPDAASIADPACETCKGSGLQLTEKKAPYARNSAETLRYLQRVLPSFELCAKIVARTNDANDAFESLKSQYVGVLRKFGNEAQTALEGDDAAQGALTGLFEAAVRFDPVKETTYFCPKCEHSEDMPTDEQGEPAKVPGGKACPNCGLPRMSTAVPNATFQTYAWNWVFRNTRARKKTEERPGLMPSIDDPGFIKTDDEGGIAANVTREAGKPAGVGEVGQSDGSSAALDLHAQVDLLEDPIQKSVLCLMLESCTTAEIAERLDITKREVSLAKKAAFCILRERLSGYSS